MPWNQQLWLVEKVGYFGYNLKRHCLYQDASQIDTSQYTHLHFAFGLLTRDFEFNKFKELQGPKRIISFGGWDFSTGPDTYTIFRDGVTADNRMKLATNIADFVNQHNLDGVDIDWEYPGAPDIPNIPPGNRADGIYYLRFLTILRELLPGKSISIAAPASYWYLKGFPIAQIAKVVDYIVYMTYDLHGQWDADNKWSQPGCPSGHCLRSNVNLTETVDALAMITKAGVPSNQVVVGVTSYGRSHGMAQAGCHTPECLFTGGPLTSTATKGPCTDTAGYISNAEIQEIIKTPGRVSFNYLEEKSDSDILVYDNTQWVGWMSPGTKARRTMIYQGINMGGTSEWAIDLESYRSAPNSGQPDNPGTGGTDNWWANFKETASTGGPQRGSRTGNWTKVQCNDPAVWNWEGLTPAQRWSEVDADDAFADVVRQWKTVDSKGNLPFSQSVVDTFHGADSSWCQVLDNGCDVTKECTAFLGEGSGPAAYLIYNSFVMIHWAFDVMDKALVGEAATNVGFGIDAFIDKFAPIPPADDNRWLFFILDLITLGATAGMGKVFNSWLSKIPYYAANPETLANAKDTVMALISGSTTIAKDLYTNPTIPGWTLEKQHDFKLWVGQAIKGIRALNNRALLFLFNGTDDGISTLYKGISNGKLLNGEGPNGGQVLPPVMDKTEIGHDLSTVIFGYSIPVIWRLSGRKPFVLDTGSPCDAKDLKSVYLNLNDRDRTRGCYKDKLYFLVMLDGPSEFCSTSCHKDNCLPQVCRPNQFSCLLDWTISMAMITALGTLPSKRSSKVKTYIQNGNTNGGDKPDITNRDTAGDLFNTDITTPGFFRIPVCSGEMAHKAWGTTDESNSNYPSLPIK